MRGTYFLADLDGEVVWDKSRLAPRTKLSDTPHVKGSELVRRVRRVGRQRGIPVELRPERGKGSHSTLYFGARFTVLRSLKDELKTGTLHAMLKQLGLTVEDLEK